MAIKLKEIKSNIHMDLKFAFTFKMNNALFFVSKNKVDLIIMNYLAFITIFASVYFMLNHAQFMYDIDSYRYFFLSNTTEDYFSGNNTSFVIFLSVLRDIFPNSEELLFLRIVNTIFTAQIVLFIYLIGRKIFNSFFALVGALLVSFAPILTSFSVTLHNDIFALAMGLGALFFMLKPRTTNLVIAAVLLSITGLTRVDTAFLFFIPFSISISYWASNKFHIRFLFFFVLVMLVFFTIGYILSQNSEIYSSRFSIIDRLILFLNYDTIEIVWKTSTNISHYELLNNLFSGILVVSAIIFLITFRKEIRRFFMLKGDKFNSKKIAVFYLMIVFFISIISNATLHVDYTIDEDGLNIKKKITDRYVIPTQILFLFGFTMVISIFSASEYFVRKFKDKHILSRKNYELKN